MVAHALARSGPLPAFEVPVNLPVDGRRIPVPRSWARRDRMAWVAVVGARRRAGALGSAWMVLGLPAYAAYRRRLGLSLGERTRRDFSPQPGPGVAVEFQTMLIPVNTASRIPADVVEVAAQLAAERRASLVVLAFTQIPLSEEMDMEIDDLEENVERLAARAASATTTGSVYS